MCKKRLLKPVFSIFVIIAVCLTASLSAFAYHPVVEISSSDWIISSSDTFKVVYPDNKDNYITSNHNALNHSYLNGESYYGSLHWNDNGYHRITRHEFSPPVCNGEWVASGDAYGIEAKRIIFEVGNTFYMAVFHSVNSVYVTDADYHTQRDLHFDVSGCCAEVDFYKIAYPFTSWQFVKFFDVYGDEDVISFSDVSAVSDVILWFSDVDIYNYKHDKIVKAADKTSYTSCVFPVNYSEPVSVLEGSVSFTIDELLLNKLEFGSFAFILDKIGFVCGMETGILSINYNATFLQNGKELGKTTFYSYSYDVLSDTYDIEVGKDYINSEMTIIDINNEFPEGVELLFEFSFVTDAYNLFFPGNISFVEFESYEDDMQHDEVMNAIDEAAGLLDGSIKNASSELSQEIANAADSIVSNSNDNASIVTSKIDESTKSITNKLQDVKNGITDKLNDVKDGITEKLEDTKNGIIEGIKNLFVPSEEVMQGIRDKWDELFKNRFGALYEVGQIISDFATSVKDTKGEKNTITMPKVKVMLVDTEFVFGGYEVQIIPDKFDVLIKTLKSIISIVCTLLFVNALKSKYDKLIGGNAV